MTSAATLVSPRASASSNRPPAHALLTSVASSADEIAALVEKRLGVVRAAETSYTIRVTRPHGPSTEAGALAMQHIVLDVAGGREIVIGRICTGAQVAWVHGHDVASVLYARRNRHALPINFGEYAELAWKLDALLSMSGFTRVPPPAIEKEERSPGMWAALATFVATIGAFLVQRS